MKYKVGDKVKVRDDLVANNYYGDFVYSENMSRLIGKTVTIETVDYNSYCIKEEREDYKHYWTDEMFEDEEASTEAEIDKFRAFLEEVANLDANSYDKEFAMLNNIVKRGYASLHDGYAVIYDYDEAVNGLCNFYRTFTPKKETKKKMTKAEIEDALGYKIEIVEE